MYSDSSLCSYVNLSSGKYYLRKGQPISKVTIHYASVDLKDFNYVMNQINGPGNYSFHYAILDSGEVGQFIRESFRAWGTGNEENDSSAVQIVVSNTSDKPPYPVSTSAVSSMMSLLEDICRRNGIRSLIFTGEASTSNVTLHKWFDPSTSCPGQYIESILTAVCSSVNLKLGSPPSSQDIYSPISRSISYLSKSYDLSTLGGETILSLDQINIRGLTPYIIQLGRDSNVSSLQISKLKQAGVSGGIVEVGRAYDDAGIGLSYSKFVNPKIDSQLKFLQSNKLEYGLILISRSTDLIRANIEAKNLQASIRKYYRSATLGVWIDRNVVCPYSMNNRIIQYFQTIFKEMGLAGKIGIKCPYGLVQQMDWDRLCNDWALWIDRGVSSMKELETILSPSFFRSK